VRLGTPNLVEHARKATARSGGRTFEVGASGVSQTRKDESLSQHPELIGCIDPEQIKQSEAIVNAVDATAPAL